MSDATFSIEVVSPERLVYSGRAVSVTAPGTEGFFEVLAGHLPMIASLRSGELVIRLGGGRTVLMAVEGGFFEVTDNKVIVLVDDAELPAEIDIDRARAAFERAKRALEDLDSHDLDRELARAALARAEARLKVATDPRAKG
jgi:F-type H+-transporting ATPase subunit epsilon